MIALSQASTAASTRRPAAASLTMNRRSRGGGARRCARARVCRSGRDRGHKGCLRWCLFITFLRLSVFCRGCSRLVLSPRQALPPSAAGLVSASAAGLVSVEVLHVLGLLRGRTSFRRSAACARFAGTPRRGSASRVTTAARPCAAYSPPPPCQVGPRHDREGNSSARRGAPPPPVAQRLRSPHT